MRKCYYIYDKEVGRVLISGCYGTIHSNDMSNCSCRDFPETLPQFEKKEYNEKLKEQNNYIKELEREVASLNRILKKVNRFK